MSNIAFYEAIDNAARFWGSEPGDETTRGTSDLARMFAAAPTNAIYHHVPTSFSLNDELSFMPVPWDMRWDILEAAISAHKPRSAATYLPFSWQIDPIFMEAMHRTKTLGTTILPGNIPLAHEMLRKLGAELVVATIDTAQTLIALLDAPASLPVKAWQIVVTASEAHRTVVLPGAVTKDLHVVPGHSAAWQCAHLGGKDFHPSSAYAWQVEEGSVLITSVSSVPAPLYRFRIANGTFEQRVCRCGQRYILTLV